MNAKEQYQEMEERRLCLVDETCALNEHSAFVERWDTMVEILGKQRARIDAYGENAYPLTERQIALIERVFEEQVSRNKIGREGYNAQQKRRQDEMDANKAAADARTPEQIEDDIITNAAQERYPVERETVEEDGMGMEAPTKAEILQAMRAWYSAAYDLDDVDAKAQRRNQSLKVLNADAAARIEAMKRLYYAFHHAETLYDDEKGQEKIAGMWQAILDSIRSQKFSWLGLLRNFQARV